MSVSNIGFALSVFIFGIVLAVITIRRMIRGQIILPGWEKWLLSAAIIAMLLIMLVSMLPPLEVNVNNPLDETYTHIVFPVDPSETTKPPQ